MKITVLTIFPEMFDGPMGASIMKRARQQGLLEFRAVDFREYAFSKHKNVDDEPFGGGAGMLLKPEPIYAALEAVTGSREDYRLRGKVLLMSPQGHPYTQEKARQLSREEELVFICGHYEGFDERIRLLADEELSIGDYVLTGGELPAMVVIDSICRLIPGVLGEEESHQTDSFSEGLLEHPHYTRPRNFRGMEVPEVLFSGNHELIRRWRRKESLRRTWQRRRGLLRRIPLTAEDQKFLEEICREEDEKSAGKD
ncbi:MAG: tRNA (guanosine(37)-N1)-methyltransferase TrmD [Peptococcaceae bacterium]|nr:tRNA (guanosine(37)-N1)-methyltransferase TrmD [Peptococcaceae bacterium]